MGFEHILIVRSGDFASVQATMNRRSAATPCP